MYAVVSTGGKQYRVAPGETLRVERLAGNVGDALELTEVLMVGGEEGQAARIGKPKLEGAKVACEIVAQDRAKKILIFKHKRRKNYRKKQGHRQDYTALKIREIVV